MSSQGSVTNWIRLLQAGRDSAEGLIFNRYWSPLVGLARAKLQGANRRVVDEEDIALGALHSFFRGIKQGRFPNLEGRDNLWRVLVTIAARKSLRLIDDERRPKNGGGRVVTETDLPPGDAEEGVGIGRLVDPEPGPDIKAEGDDEFERLLALLDDDVLRSIARWKIVDDYTNAEIARKLGCVEKTVERKVEMIRERWEEFG